MAELFGVKVPAVNNHLKNIFETGKLDENSVISILETTASDEKKYSVKFYRIEDVPLVGYLVNFVQAADF